MLNNRTRQNNRKAVQTRSDNPFVVNFDANSYAPGFNSISELIYECASNSRTVQIDEQSVIISGNANLGPIGKILNKNNKGLALDSAVSNIIQDDPYNWSASNIVKTLDTNSTIPSATMCEDNSLANSGYISNAMRSPYTNGQSIYFQAFLRKNPANLPTVGTDVYLQLLNPGQTRFFQTSILNTYYNRYQFAPFTLNLTSSFSSRFYPSTGVANAVGATGIWGWQVWQGSSLASEYYDGVRAGACLKLPNTAIQNGKLSLEVQFYPRGASSEYSTVYLFYIDANNYCTYSGSTSKFTIVIDGNSYTTTQTFNWTATTFVNNVLTNNKFVKLWISCGNGNSIIQMQVDGGTVLIDNSASSQNSLVSSGNFSILSKSDDLTQYQLSAHITNLRVYKNNYKPEWVI